MQIHRTMINTKRQVTAWRYGDRIDIVYTSIPPKKTKSIEQINELEYVVLSTGEVREYKMTENSKNQRLVMLAMHQLRRIISGNYDPTQKQKTLFITLTYAENMKDPEKLYLDFKQFIRLVRSKTGQKIEYICVREPQERGAWHCHAMLIGERNLYIKPDDLRKMWPRGRCKAERIKDVDSAGAYLCAYFCNTEKGAKKMGRIEMYPKNFKFYTTSRGIVKPEKITTTIAELGEMGEVVYQKEYEVDLGEGITNQVVKRTYKINEDKPREK